MAGKLVGTRFSGRYLAEEWIGGGGTSEVYRAKDEETGEAVALKVIEGFLADTNAVKDRFTREVAVLRRLASPHIVRVRDAGIEEGRMFLALDLLTGETLATKLRREQKLSLEETLAIIDEVLRGLTVAHEAQVVHRDLKPDNIMLEEAHRSSAASVSILDFGFAKLAQADATTLPLALTKVGTAVGTPYYMAPEQARGDTDVSHAADLYSLGVVMFECLAGRPPHVGANAEEIMVAHNAEAAPDIRTFEPNTPPEVAHFLRKALKRKPEERFRTAKHMRERLALLREAAPRKKWVIPVLSLAAMALGILVMLVAISLFSGCKSKSPPAAGTQVTPQAQTAAAPPNTLAARPVRYASIPKSYDSKLPSPLLLILHGFGSDGPSHARMFDFGAYVEQERMIIAAPDGTLQPASGARFWNAVPACCDFEIQRPDDVAYLREVVADYRRRYNIDPHRIYALGHSNGGAMAMRLACDASDLFAAVFSLAGPFYDDMSACKPSEPVSVRLVHGTGDKVVPYEGGQLRAIHPNQRARVTPSAPKIAQFFGTANGCGAPTVTAMPLVVDGARKGPGNEVERFGGCKNDTAVELWTVAGMGHAWAEPGPDLMADIWQFLAAHKKR